MRRIYSKFAAIVILVFLLITPHGSLLGQSGDDLMEIRIALIGPGDELYFWWGHIGLIIDDHLTASSRFYDWGIFSFDNENFFVNFALGRLLYTCGVSPPDWNYQHYVNTNRDIILYTLNLPLEKKREVQRFAEWSILPENKDYFYHHFRDNCATRLRDILDMAVDGQFKERYNNEPGRFSLRQHVYRHTWFNPFFDWILSFWMSRVIDTPITVWDEMFLPSEIALRIQEFSYIDPNGFERNMVSNVETRFQSQNRPIVLDIPRLQWPGSLTLGCIMALLFLLLRFIKSQEDKPGLKKLWALAQGFFGLFFGFAGLMLFFMMFFTDHDYTYNNINIFFANPLLIAALPMGICYYKAPSPIDRSKWELIIKTFWTCFLVLCLISILLNQLPFFRQQNQLDLTLILPSLVALSWLPDFFVYIRREYLWRWFTMLT